MKRWFKKAIAAIILTVSILSAGVPVFAGGICETGPNAGVYVEDISGCQQSGKTVDGLVKNVINLMLGLIGLLSVIMIIYAGLKYVISEGDSTKIKQAKQILTYAIVGLVVALLAFAIVNFVINGLFPASKN